MSFYGDLLRDYENRYTKNTYTGVPVYFKFRTNASDNTSIKQAYKLTRKTDDSTTEYTSVNGTTLKTNCCGKEISSKLKVGSNNNAIYEVTYKPADLNKPDQVLQLKHKTQYKEDNGSFESTETLKFAPSKMGPVRAWLNLDFIWNNKVANKKTLKGGLNFNYEDYHFGGSADYDLTKVNTMQFLGLLKNAKGDFFARFHSGNDKATKQDFQKVTLGCHHSHGTKAIHAIELSYYLQGFQNGLLGQPVWLRWVGQYKLTDDATVKTKLDLGDSYQFGFAWIHKFNQNLNVAFTHDINLNQVLKNKPASTNFGVALQWNL